VKISGIIRTQPSRKIAQEAAEKMVLEELQARDKEQLSTTAMNIPADEHNRDAVVAEQKVEPATVTIEQIADSGGAFDFLKKEVPYKERTAMKEIVSAQSGRTLDIGIIGVGGCGCKMADAFAAAGYDVAVINLTDRDFSHLTNIPNDDLSRIELVTTAGGAGRDPEKGAQAVKEYANTLVKKLQRKFNNKEFLFVCSGLGGGTGTLGGSLVGEILASFKIPVGAIVTLPRKNEGTDEKVNCLKGLQAIANNKLLKSIIVVDNQKIAERLKGVQDSNFWRMANEEIVALFDTFNRLSSLPSDTAFDAEDYRKCLATPGFLVLGSSLLPTSTVTADATEAQLAEAIKSIDKGLLATGFDHKSAIGAAGLIVRPKTFEYSHGIEEALFSHLKSEIGAGRLNRGIYTSEILNTDVAVFTMLAGMKLPELRVKELIDEAQNEASEMSGKVKERLGQVVSIDMPKDMDLITKADLNRDSSQSLNSNLLNRRR
jgi:cell division GTPase FtsZ